jgi:signal transduction histidine kinase
MIKRIWTINAGQDGLSGRRWVTDATQGNMIVLKITDTGKGILSKHLPKLTDPFTRADADPYLAEQGWGPGLSITKSLVELHDGTMDIKSKVGKGTTVTVNLPHAVL